MTVNDDHNKTSSPTEYRLLSLRRYRPPKPIVSFGMRLLETVLYVIIGCGSGLFAAVLLREYLDKVHK